MTRKKPYTRKIGRGGKYDSIIGLEVRSISSKDIDISETLKDIGDNSNPLLWIERYETQARKILSDAGLPTELISENGYLTGLPEIKESVLEPVSRAANILHYAHVTRQNIESGEVLDSVYSSMILQEHIDMLIFSGWELHARKGQERFGWQSNGGKGNATPNNVVEDWKKQYPAIKINQPNISKREAAKQIDLSKFEIIRKII